MSKNPQIVRKEETHCPPFNENQNIIEYLESLDDDKQNEHTRAFI